MQWDNTANEMACPDCTSMSLQLGKLREYYEMQAKVEGCKEKGCECQKVCAEAINGSKELIDAASCAETTYPGIPPPPLPPPPPPHPPFPHTSTPYFVTPRPSPLTSPHFTSLQRIMAFTRLLAQVLKSQAKQGIR